MGFNGLTPELSDVALHPLVSLFGSLQCVQAFLQILQGLLSKLQPLLQLHSGLDLGLKTVTCDFYELIL